MSDSPELDRRARPHAFIWVVRFTAALAVVALAGATWAMFQPSPARTLGYGQARRDGGWIVANVETGGPAQGILQVGDRLVAIDGDTDVALGGSGFYRTHLDIGSNYRLTIERDGAFRDFTLPVVPVTDPFSSRWIWFFEGVLWTAIGLFIGFARPEHPVARIAFTGCIVNGLFYFLQMGVFRGVLVPLAVFPLHVVLGFHFFYRFPGGVPPSRLWSTTLVAFYVCAAVAVLSQLLRSWTFYADGVYAATELSARFTRLFQAREIMAQSLYSAAIAAMILVIPRNYRLLTEPDQRRRVRWVVYSSMIGLTPLLWTSSQILWRMFFGGTPGPTWWFVVANAATAAIPISTAYVVVKHRVFDARFVLRRGIQYLFARQALQILLALPAAGLLYVIVTRRDQTVSELFTQTEGYLYWMGAATVSLRYRHPLRGWLDRRFFREEHDRERVLVGLLDDLGRVEVTSDLSPLVSAQLEYALHPKAMYLWYREDRDDPTMAQASDGRLVPMRVPGEELLAYVPHDGPLDLLAGSAELPRGVARWLAELDVHLIVPLVGTGTRVTGLLMLGEKKSEEPYGLKDRRLLQAIAKQLAVVRENLQLKAQVGEEVRIRHDVLGHLQEGLVNLLKECELCGACFDSPAVHCERDGRPLTLTMPIERTIDGKYRLDQLIGRGGMGSVYEARDLRLDRPVAIKVMLGRAFGQGRAVRRFEREARAAAGLSHPNIVAVHDYGALPGDAAYLVMERIYGVTLRAALDRPEPPDLEEIGRYFAQLCNGVAAAHDRGIVHRDLKPENVVIQDTGPEGARVKILDFGLAKVKAGEEGAGGTSTTAGVVLGTLTYMAPEQLLGAEVDHRSDLFSIGVMLAEAITGTRPFKGNTYAEMMRSVLLDAYHLPGEDATTRRLDALLQRCLAKEPANRWGSAEAMKDELMAVLADLPLRRQVAGAP